MSHGQGIYGGTECSEVQDGCKLNADCLVIVKKFVENSTDQ